MRRYIIITITAFAILFMGGCGDRTNSNTESMDVETSLSSVRVKPTDNTIEIYWDYSDGVKGYILEFGEKNRGLEESVTLSADTTSYKAVNLQEDTNYIFRLTTLFKDDTKRYSDILQAKTSTQNKIYQSDEGAKI